MTAIVGVLNKHAVAVAADSAATINGTLGRKVLNQANTKSDGFVWIKRKHYFQPDLNHHFSSNYYIK